MAVSTTHVEESCLVTPCTSAVASFNNFFWRTLDSVAEPDELVEAPAAYLTDCDDYCSECHKFFMSKTPEKIWYECVDYREMKFIRKCRNDMSSCMTAEPEYCLYSYPFSDRKERKCRTVPNSYRGTFSSNKFKFQRRRFPKKAGLCHINCKSTCHFSWLKSDYRGRRGPSLMLRCKD